MIYVGIAETSHSKVLRRLAGNCPGSTRNACGATVQHEGAIGGPLMTILFPIYHDIIEYMGI